MSGNPPTWFSPDYDENEIDHGYAAQPAPPTEATEARAREVLGATAHSPTCEMCLDLGARVYSCSCDRVQRAMLTFAKERAATDTTPPASDAVGEAIEAGKVVLEGRGDGTYDEAQAAIRLLIAASPKVASVTPPHDGLLDIEQAIRTAVWNVCRARGMMQDTCVDVVKRVIAEPVLSAALSTEAQPADRYAEIEAPKNGEQDPEWRAIRRAIDQFVGRVPVISKYRAVHNTVIAETVARLDAAGDREAADVIVWQCWYRALDRERERFLLADAAEKGADRYAEGRIAGREEAAKVADDAAARADSQVNALGTATPARSYEIQRRSEARNIATAIRTLASGERA